jgi:hypothetical protein
VRSFRHSTALRVLFVMGLGALSAAPTPGDVGGCGQHPDPLDPAAFFIRKRTLDCEKCGECGFQTDFCGEACTATEAEPSFPTGCVPLVHDGEVCLNAIEAASCGEYEDYSKDQGRLSPSECQFCPELVP